MLYNFKKWSLKVHFFYWKWSPILFFLRLLGAGRPELLLFIWDFPISDKLAGSLSETYSIMFTWRPNEPKGLSHLLHYIIFNQIIYLYFPFCHWWLGRCFLMAFALQVGCLFIPCCCHHITLGWRGLRVHINWRTYLR